VLAVTRELASAPWQLVAKVDRSEALAGVRETAMQAAFALLGVCAALTSSFLGTWLALRARAQARLARAEARLSSLLDLASDVILVIDADGRIRDANERTVELYGYPREALRGQHVSELLRDKDRELVRQRNTALLAQGRMVWESTHVTRDGRELPVEVAARSVELDGERLTVAIIRDISERKRAEEAIRHKDRLLHLTGEMAQVGGWEFDARTRRGTWTDEVARIHDLEPGLETNVELGLGFYSGESRRRIDAALKAAIEAGEPYDLELEMTSARGVRKWVRTMGLPIVGDGGVVRVQGIFQDVTARRQAEDEIRRLNADLERRVAERTSELARLNDELQREVEGRARAQLAVERYAREVEDLYNHAPCGYHSLDADGRFVTVNDTELEWLGYTRAELLGRSVLDVFFPSARETFASRYPEFRRHGTLRDLELEMRRKDGTRFWALLNATAVRDEKGGYLRSRSTMFDISDLVQARQEVARRTAALEAANRELEAFSYSVSHDLRAPLRAIAGFSSLLASDYSEKLDAEARGLLDRVCDNTRRMSQLIDDLLAFSGVGRKEMNPGRLSMNGLVAACVAELTAGLDPSRLEIEVATLPDAFGDASMLRQVWTNLLSNALKFTGPRPRARILVRGCSEKGERVYSVEDNGVGFDERYAGKLFGVFQRLHNQREFPGTGVGLALVQRVVERHGGRVWAASRQGEGATFCFALPAPAPEGSASD